MQKKLKCSAIIDGKHYTLTLSKTLIKDFNNQDFFENFPNLYFRPKNQNIELWSSGLIYSSSQFIKIKSSFDIPSFFIGDSSTYKSWGDLRRAMHIIPHKWIVKKGKRLILYQWDIPSCNLNDMKIEPLQQETSFEKAIDSINTIKSHIEKNTFSKYVFAVMQKKELSASLSINQLEKYPVNGTKFFFKFSNKVSFLGITPEWLYRRYKEKIFIDAVAGTASKDNSLELESDKIIDEFAFVKKDIKESIHAIIEDGSFEDQDSLIFAGQLAHRYNCFKGNLKKGICEETLVNSLHPTAAISGYPKVIARLFFQTFETFERGYFAAPIGFYSQKKSYVAVAIRSMLINNKQSYLFAGAGITKDSLPELEWQELTNKMDVMCQFLDFTSK